MSGTSGSDHQSIQFEGPLLLSFSLRAAGGKLMNTIIYIVGLVVIIGVILSYFGFR